MVLKCISLMTSEIEHMFIEHLDVLFYKVPPLNIFVLGGLYFSYRLVGTHYTFHI